VLPPVEDELRCTEAEGITDTNRIAQAVCGVVRKCVEETYRRRPMIVPTVIRMEVGRAGPKSRPHEVRWCFPAGGLFM
jgi:ribonuclease J